MYIRRSEDVQDVLCTFNSRPVSTGLFTEKVSENLMKISRDFNKASFVLSHFQEALIRPLSHFLTFKWP